MNEIIIEIEVCANCEKHSWFTSHKQKRYDEAYDSLQSQLVKEIPNVKVVRNPIPSHFKKLHNKFFCEELYYDPMHDKVISMPRIGAFEISVFDRVIFSKIKSGNWPNVETIIDLMKKIIEDKTNGKSIETYSIPLKDIPSSNAPPNRRGQPRAKSPLHNRVRVRTENSQNSNTNTSFTVNAGGSIGKTGIGSLKSAVIPINSQQNPRPQSTIKSRKPFERASDGLQERPNSSSNNPGDMSFMQQISKTSSLGVTTTQNFKRKAPNRVNSLDRPKTIEGQRKVPNKRLNDELSAQKGNNKTLDEIQNEQIIAKYSSGSRQQQQLAQISYTKATQPRGRNYQPGGAIEPLNYSNNSSGDAAASKKITSVSFQRKQFSRTGSVNNEKSNTENDELLRKNRSNILADIQLNKYETDSDHIQNMSNKSKSYPAKHFDVAQSEQSDEEKISIEVKVSLTKNRKIVANTTKTGCTRKESPAKQVKEFGSPSINSKARELAHIVKSNGNNSRGSKANSRQSSKEKLMPIEMQYQHQITNSITTTKITTNTMVKKPSNKRFTDPPDELFFQNPDQHDNYYMLNRTAPIGEDDCVGESYEQLPHFNNSFDVSLNPTPSTQKGTASPQRCVQDEFYNAGQLNRQVESKNLPTFDTLNTDLANSEPHNPSEEITFNTPQLGSSAEPIDLLKTAQFGSTFANDGSDHHKSIKSIMEENNITSPTELFRRNPRDSQTKSPEKSSLRYAIPDDGDSASNQLLLAPGQLKKSCLTDSTVTFAASKHIQNSQELEIDPIRKANNQNFRIRKFDNSQEQKDFKMDSFSNMPFTSSTKNSSKGDKLKLNEGSFDFDNPLRVQSVSKNNETNSTSRSSQKGSSMIEFSFKGVEDQKGVRKDFQDLKSNFINRSSLQKRNSKTNEIFLNQSATEN